MNDISLSISSLSSQISPKKLLKIDNISIESGRRVALLGLNGAGKSSLIRLLVGETLANLGSIEYRHPENPRKTLTPSLTLFKARLGYQSDTMLAIAELSGSQYLELIGASKGLTSSEIKQGIEETSEKWHLEELLNAKMSQLSKGNLQKLAIAQVFLCNPHWLIFDEPCQSLDPMEQERFNQNIQSLVNFQLCIFSTHNVQHALDVAQDILLIHQYKVLFHFDFTRELSYLLVIKQADDEKLGFMFGSKDAAVSNNEHSFCVAKPISPQITHLLFHDNNGLDEFLKTLEQQQLDVHFCLSERSAVLPLFRLMASGEILLESSECSNQSRLFEGAS
jgi:ABC-2 type transport system ATP-binding protein